MNTLLLFIIAGLLIFAIFETIYIVYHIQIAHQLGKELPTCSQHAHNPQKRILIIGDSIARGTGAQDYKNSLCGRLASEHPEADVINLSENAIGTAYAVKQINEIPEETLGHFDTVIIRVGAMDILTFKSTRATVENFRKLLDITRSKLCPAGQIILVSPGNVGGTKLYRHFPVGNLLSWRSHKLNNALAQLVKEKDVTFINLCTHPKDDPWATNPTLLAKDKIHPNDEGYALLYDYVSKVMK